MNSDVTIFWEGRPSQWSTIMSYVIAIVLIVGGFVLNPTLISWLAITDFQGYQPGWWLSGLGLAYALWHFLVVRCVRYSVTEERLLDESGVLNRITDTLELYRIKDT